MSRLTDFQKETIVTLMSTMRFDSDAGRDAWKARMSAEVSQWSANREFVGAGRQLVAAMAVEDEVTEAPRP